MGVIHVCDLCGKPLGLDGYKKKYKIKEETTSLWGEHGWVTIEAHDECVRKLLDGVKRNGL